jgi:hypothetical protein
MTGASIAELAAYLGEEEAQALSSWGRATGRIVEIPARRWSSAGYTGATLHSVVVTGGASSTHCILKSIPPEPDGASGREVGREPVQHEFAVRANPEFARDHLVGQPFDAIPGRGWRVLMFQSFVADGAPLATAAELSPDRLPGACAYLVRQLLDSWNAGRVVGRKSTVSGVLSEALGSALRPEGTIAAWTGDAQISDITVPWIQFRKDGPVVPNPVLPVSSGLLFGDRGVDVLHGLVHGDLHLRNILVPSTPDGSPSLARYALIDLATFKESGSLTRDPVCLLMSAVAETFSSVAAEHEDALIDVVLGGDAGRRSEPPFAVAVAVRAAMSDAVGALGKGYSGMWPLQFLVSVQAQALRFTSYRLPARLKWWSFRLSAAAAARIWEMLDGPKPPGSARLVASPFVDQPEPDSASDRAASARAALERAVSGRLAATKDNAADAPANVARLLRWLGDDAAEILGEQARTTIEVRYHQARWTRRAGDLEAAAQLEQQNWVNAVKVLDEGDELAVNCERAFFHRPIG